MLFPSPLNRYGPLVLTTRRRNGRRDSNGEIFRPYLTCERSNDAKISKDKRMRRLDDVVTDNIGVGYSEIYTVMDIVDTHGVFWAHEACLIWSRSNFKSTSKDTEEDHVDGIEENLKQVRNLPLWIFRDGYQ